MKMLSIVCCLYGEVWQYERLRIYPFYLQNESLCTNYIIASPTGNSFPIVLSGEV
jgi:hypothetical protein